MQRKPFRLNEQFIQRVRYESDDVENADEYPFCLPLLRGFDELELHAKVTFIVGENGSGKSTLLEAMAVAWGFNAEGGTKNFNFESRASHSDLYKYLTLVRGFRKPLDGFFLRAESFFNVATEAERLEKTEARKRYGLLHEQSHGESFMSLMVNSFGSRSLFILDEPEAALSPARQMAMLSRLHELVEQGCQFIIATHSPIVMAYPDALIYELSESGVKSVDYEECEHYQLTKRFLNKREDLLKILLNKD